MIKQKGFTMIELIVVIVILGILAATAMPKFLDLREDAAQAALEGVHGAIQSANSQNYAIRSAFPSKGVQTHNRSCQDVVNDFLQGGLPDGYYVENTVISDPPGTQFPCELESDEGALKMLSITSID